MSHTASRIPRYSALVAAAIVLGLLVALVFTSAPARSGLPPVVGNPATFQTRASVGEIYVREARPGAELVLFDELDRQVDQVTADRFGSAIFYYLDQGATYTVREVVDGTTFSSPEVKVLEMDDNPDPSFYEGEDKELRQGLNYVEMRDGVELAMTVRLPAGKTLADGPFPTFIEYSGYQVAAPNAFPIGGGNDPLAPASSTSVGSLIGPLLNYAVVSVQMRGSGCSGGAFDLFGLPTIYDGYDAIETVAAQDWVKGGKVGMGGISFSGITQLLTAGTKPPSLAGISPLSVTDDVYSATGYPGGIFNTGFAYSWISERARDAEPAPEGGQPYARILSDPTNPNYDPRCAANQELRLQTQDFEQTIQDNPYRTPQVFELRAPGYWMSRIEAPVFLVGAFQDEQTGGHFVNSLARLSKNRDVWLSLMNGVHVDSLGPSTITRWIEFMDLFVADRLPSVPPIVLGLSQDLYEGIANAPSVPVEDVRDYRGMTVAQARDKFRQDRRVRLLMENGAAIPETPGALGAKWELNFDSWPIRSVKPTRYFLAPGGRLAPTKPRRAATAAYTADPSARPEQTITDGSEWQAQPNYDWQPLAPGKGLGFITPKLTRDTVMAGNASLDLWLKSSALDTDLQATITEVRPDGKEVLVQNGWLRASHRKLYPKRSTALNPVPTHLEGDAEPLARGKFNYVRVPVFAFAHAFRKGSRVRLNIQAPGGDRQIWKFDTVDDGTARNVIALGRNRASRLVLPVVASAGVKGTPRPPANALRGQPSRDYAPATNGG